MKIERFFFRRFLLYVHRPENSEISQLVRVNFLSLFLFFFFLFLLVLALFSFYMFTSTLIKSLSMYFLDILFIHNTYKCLILQYLIKLFYFFYSFSNNKQSQYAIFSSPFLNNYLKKKNL